VVLSLPPISEKRRTERDFWRDFEARKPAILGALFDAVSVGIREVGNVEIESTARMADFERLGCALAPAFGWTPEFFLNAYRGNRFRANDVTLETSAIYEPLRKYVSEWPGTAVRESPTSAELLQRLSALAGDAANLSGWPKNPKALSDHLRRLAPNLQRVGIRVSWPPRENDRRPLLIERLEV
jgi:putative DNA primase/helicase